MNSTSYLKIFLTVTLGFGALHVGSLLARLRAEGVEAVDLATPFQEHKNEGLFFPYDTHRNGNGTTLAAKVIAEQIFGNPANAR